MKHIFFTFGLICNFFINAQKPKLEAFDKNRLSRLDSFMTAYVAAGKAPNVSIFVAHKGKTIVHKSFGYSDLEQKVKIKNDDIYRIASQTKLLTSLCVMMLMEEGHFLLDDPIERYIPSFANPTILGKVDPQDPSKYETVPAQNKITIRHLLAHTAGIPYEHPLEQLSEFKVPYFCSTEADVLAEVVDKIAKRPLLSEPGTKYVYGLNTDVLGRLVEVVSGKSLATFIQDRLLRPLGMQDTYFYLPQEKSKRLVKLYSKSTIAGPLVENEVDDYKYFAVSGAKTYYSGGAGLVSTITDYAKVCQLILDFGSYKGQQIVGRKTIEMMIKNNIGENFVWDRNDKFSLGLQIGQDDSRYMDNASTGSLTWGGMYCSEYTIDHKEDLICLMFTNVHPYAHYQELVRKFRILVYQALR